MIAADGGLAHAHALGLDVQLAVGDFDSAPEAAVKAAEANGTRIERHPAEKDATDLELALDAALALDSERIVVLAGVGERLDDLLSALLLLGSRCYEDVELDAVVGPARVHVIRRERTLEGAPGELVSLLALHGPAEVVRTDGRPIRWPGRRSSQARVAASRTSSLRRPRASPSGRASSSPSARPQTEDAA